MHYLLHLCYVFRTLINSLVCTFSGCTVTLLRDVFSRRLTLLWAISLSPRSGPQWPIQPRLSSTTTPSSCSGREQPRPRQTTGDSSYSPSTLWSTWSSLAAWWWCCCCCCCWRRATGAWLLADEEWSPLGGKKLACGWCGTWRSWWLDLWIDVSIVLCGLSGFSRLCSSALCTSKNYEYICSLSLIQVYYFREKRK